MISSIFLSFSSLKLFIIICCEKILLFFLKSYTSWNVPIILLGKAFNPIWAGLFWKSQGCRGPSRPAVKKHAVFQKLFIHFTWNFVHILYWQYEISLEKKNWQMSLLSSFDDVIMKVMCWRFLSFLGIDVFLLVTNGI